MPTKRSYRSAASMMLVAGGLVAAVPAHSTEVLSDGQLRVQTGKAEFLCNLVLKARGGVKVSQDRAAAGFVVGCNSHVKNRARKTELFCGAARNARGADKVGITCNARVANKASKTLFNCNGLQTAREAASRAGIAREAASRAGIQR